MADATARYGHAFCETIAANLTHIRELTSKGRKEGGGADTKGLCGADVLWDRPFLFTADRAANWNPWPYQLCQRCKAEFEERSASKRKPSTRARTPGITEPSPSVAAPAVKRRRSLTKFFRPQYDAMVRTIVANGWTWPGWTGPDFRVRRSRGADAGKYSIFEIVVYVGPSETYADVYQTVAHELAHALTHDESEHHGPRFRARLRSLIRAHWPSVGPWSESDAQCDESAYAEDDRITEAMRQAYPHMIARVDP